MIGLFSFPFFFFSSFRVLFFFLIYYSIRNEKTVYSEVNVMVTTHRLFIISNIKDTPHKAIQLSLANITELDTVRLIPNISN